MSQSAFSETPRAPRHERLFELLRQQALANERYFPPPAQEGDKSARKASDFQNLAQASLQRGASLTGSP